MSVGRRWCLMLGAPSAAARSLPARGSAGRFPGLPVPLRGGIPWVPSLSAVLKKEQRWPPELPFSCDTVRPSAICHFFASPARPRQLTRTTVDATVGDCPPMARSVLRWAASLFLCPLPRHFRCLLATTSGAYAIAAPRHAFNLQRSVSCVHGGHPLAVPVPHWSPPVTCRRLLPPLSRPSFLLCGCLPLPVDGTV